MENEIMLRQVELNYWFSKCHQELELMQYTGLKDENEKEVYEGDLVECQNPGPWEVYWRSETRAGRKVANFALKRLDDDWIIPFYNVSSFEIIGNIYENTELLNE